MKSTFSKDKSEIISKLRDQRVITLISMFAIIISFALLVTHNTLKKSYAANNGITSTQTEATNTASNEASKKSTATTGTGAPQQENKSALGMNKPNGTGSSAQQQTGEITIDGSSVVGIISQLAADQYSVIRKGIKVTVGVSGSEEGMNNFSTGKLDVWGSTRKITSEEAGACKSNGIDFSEIKLGYDTVVIVVNKGNTFIDSISITELRKIWDSRGKARRWDEVNSKWPASLMKAYNSKDEPMTQNFFSDVLFGNGSVQLSKINTTVENGKELLQSIISESDSIGFCSYNLYESNKDKLKALGIATAGGAVLPAFDTIKSGTYNPLSRELYLYISKKSLQKDYIKDFVRTYIENASKYVKTAGYLPCEEGEYKKYLESFN